MAFKELRTGDANLDRVQANVSAAFAALADTSPSPVLSVTESTQPADGVSYVLVNSQRGAVRINVPKTRALPLTILSTMGPNAVTVFPKPQNGSEVIAQGAAVKVLMSNGKLWILSEFLP